MTPNPIEQAAGLNEAFRLAGWKARIKVTHPNERDYNICFTGMKDMTDMEQCGFDMAQMFLAGMQATLCVMVEEADRDESND